MKRSPWVTGVTLIQFLLGLLLLGTSIYLIFLTRSPEVKQGQDAAEAVHGLKIAVGIVAPVAILLLVAAWGMWKSKLWGWWLAFLTEAGIFVLFLLSMVDDGWADIDWEMAGFTAVFAVFVVLLLLPRVRKFYWQGSSTQLKSAAVDPKP